MAMRKISGFMGNGSIDQRDLTSKIPLIAIAIGVAGLGWMQTGSLGAAMMIGLLGAGLARFGLGIGAKPAMPVPPQGDSAGQLAAGARGNIARITARAASLDDDEVNFRAGRLKNTVTLLIEALQDDPSRHAELQGHLGFTLGRLTETVDQFAAKYSATGDGNLRGEFLRYLQEAELQFEYVARSFVLGRHKAY